MNHARLVGACLLATSTLLTACDDDDDPSGPENTATVRFVNTTGTALDVGTDGTFGAANSNVAFGAGTGCMVVNAATPGITLRQNGTTTNLTGFTPNFQSGVTYTVVIGGTAAAPTYRTFTDTYTGAAAGGGAVRVINATTGATAYNLYLGTAGSLPTTALNTSFTAGSATQFLPIVAGDGEVLLTTGTGVNEVDVLLTDPFPVAAGSYRTLIIAPPATGSAELRSFFVNSCAT